MKEAVARYKAGEKYTVISGYAGSGKAQPIDTIIPTPKGNKKIGELKIGDYVFDKEGNPTKVLGIFPQGKLDVYTLKLKDGRETKCGIDHLWTVIDRKSHIKTLSTRELIEAKLVDSAGYKYSLPNNGVIKYSKKDFAVDPYAIGASLGHNNKKIPDIYKYGDEEQRLSLVQGLMDTNGSISISNVWYTSVNFKLVKDMQEVLNSLGYHSNIIRNNNNYNLNIYIDNKEKYKLFRLKKKKDDIQNIKKNVDYNKIPIMAINKEDYQEEMVCIYVDNPEHLYLTNDCIVTHNTTLIKFIIEALKINPKKVAYCTYTGKAASVLAHKGCPNAITAHKLILETRKHPDGTFSVFPRKELLNNPRVVVVDEISMMPKWLWNYLIKYGVYIIAIGDPFQLPPINSKENNHLLDYPHVFLDEIMRQAAESDIIQLSMAIREGKTLSPFIGHDVRIYEKFSPEVTDGMYFWADEIIAATNRTIDNINSYIRKSLGKGALPEKGDKVICRENNWNTIAQNTGNALVNGTIGYLGGPFAIKNHVNLLSSKQHNIYADNLLIADIKTPEGDSFEDLLIDYPYLIKGEPSLMPEQENELYANKVPLPAKLSYGYAITCHRAQGSQWGKVLVFEENFPFSREAHARWLYTACTRSEDKLVIVKK